MDNEGDFLREMHSGWYRTYMVLSENIQLAETTLGEIREAVYRGEELLFAGPHDLRLHKLEEPNGIQFTGSGEADSIALSAPDIFDPVQNPFAYSERVWPATPTTAAVGGHRMSADVTTGVGVTLSTYGAGRSLYSGFDLMAQGTLAGLQSDVSGFLLDTLIWLEGDTPEFPQGQVLPLVMTLTNEGAAVSGRVILELPATLAVIKPGDFSVVPGGQPEWQFSLAADGTASAQIWITSTDASSNEAIARIEVLQNGTMRPFGQTSVLITPMQTLDFDQTLDVLEELRDAHPNEPAFRHAIQRLEMAFSWQERSRFDKAVAEALKAANAMMAMANPSEDAVRARQGIGAYLRTLGMMSGQQTKTMDQK